MNHHELIDVATVGVAGLMLGRSKFFVRRVESPPLGDVVAGASVDSPAVDWFGGGGVPAVDDPGVRTVEVRTPVGTYGAAFLPWRWLGPERPTLLYHHGSGERPFDFGRFASNSFRRLFAGGAFDVPVNLVAVRAPFHDRSAREYARAMGELPDFVGMLASSTALVERLRERLVDAGCPAVTVAGISLGGFVANLHRAYVGGADRYVPMFAGAALGETFVTSAYRRLTGGLARSNPGRLREVLDFEDPFLDVERDDCAPLLGRYDRIVEPDRQTPGYAGLDVAVIEKGHVTGALATGPLLEHVRRNVVRT